MSWELSKENVQPLRSGRRVDALEANSNLDTRSQQDYFEREVRTGQTLDPWVAYVKWTEQTYTSDSRHLVALLEKAIAKFKDDPVANKDARYLDLWIKYSSLSKESPLDVFAFLYDHDLCTNHGRFYEVWAEHLEAAGNVKKTEAVFKKALEKFRGDRQAELSLRSKQDRFHMRQWQLTMQQEEETDKEQEEEQRIQLASLRSHDKQVGSQRVGSAILSSGPGRLALGNNAAVSKNQQSRTSAASSKSVSDNNAQFAIFTDENTAPSSALKNPSSRRQDVVSATRNAENEQKACQWPKAAGVATSKKFVPVVPSKPDFNIHKDEQQPTVNNSSSGTKRMGIEMRALCTKKPEVADVNCPLAIFEPPDPSMKPMYCKHLVYEGVTEFSFEELRAAKYEKAKEEEVIAMRRLAQEKEEERLRFEREKVEQELQRALKMQKALEEEQAAIKREKDELEKMKAQMRSVSFENVHDSRGSQSSDFPGHSEKPLVHNLQSPTVNTKEALALVQGLWDQGGSSSNHAENEESRWEDEDSQSTQKPSSTKKTPSFQNFDDLEADNFPPAATKQAQNNLPFAIYSDSIREDHNKENDTPHQMKQAKTYQPTNNNPPSGALMPSKAGPLAPRMGDDKKENHDPPGEGNTDENKGSFELMPPPSGQLINKSAIGRTMLVPSVEEFEKFAQFSSTPFHGRRNFEEDLDADTCQVEIITRAKPEVCSEMSGTTEVPCSNKTSSLTTTETKDEAAAAKKFLSPIFETSRELNYKSSSSSGSQTMWASGHQAYATANSYQLHHSNAAITPKPQQSSLSLKTPATVNNDVSSGYVADLSTKTPQQSSYHAAQGTQKPFLGPSSIRGQSSNTSTDYQNSCANSRQLNHAPPAVDNNADEDDLMDEDLMKLVQNYRRENQQKSVKQRQVNDSRQDESLWTRDTLLLPREEDAPCYTSLVEQESFLEKMKNSSMRRNNDDEDEITFSEL